MSINPTSFIAQQHLVFQRVNLKKMVLHESVEVQCHGKSSVSAEVPERKQSVHENLTQLWSMLLLLKQSTTYNVNLAAAA